MRSTQQSARTKKAKDAISLLEADHDTVRELLSKLESTTTRGTKKREELLARIAVEVEVHAAIEEEIFYPAFREKAETQEDEKLFLEAAEEHQLVHITLPALQDTDPATELFSARAKVLKDLIEHHADEEEDELLPRARKLMSKDELEELGARLQARKGELAEERGPRNQSRARVNRSAENGPARKKSGPPSR